MISDARARGWEGAGPRTRAFLNSLVLEFPALRVVEKEDDRFSRTIAGAVAVLTAGRQRLYLTHYVTTLGQRIYIHTGFWERGDEACYIVMRHEAVHLRQFARWTFLGMAFLYLFPWFPLGLAYGRARLEWAAYAETFRATAEVHGADAARDPALRAHVVRQFTSGAYGWMWPFPRSIGRWVDAELRAIDRPRAS